MQLTVLFAVLLGMAATGHALKCFTCRGKSVDAGSVGGTLSGTAKPCSEFNKTDTSFQMTCPTTHDKSCLKVTDGDDVMRSCANVDKDECLEDSDACYCKKDLCNSSARGWPSALLLLAALAAALFGFRR
ncbi:hypothetical protein FJT64_013378 [Amphibalanus amphitrite]|uniref:Protein sleepless n=1 Tax=Amphibalanus amphitrite TaxID=1232801 RepID=A0A6A4UWV1_AMPAM|nr:hypothetical protein FJT64_013378 [Amphibalanus amphitrite]